MIRILEEEGVAGLQGYTLYGLKWATLRLAGIQSLADPTAKSLMLNFDRTDATSSFWRVGWAKGIIERFGLKDRDLAAACTHPPSGRPSWRAAILRHMARQVIRLDWDYVEVQIGDTVYRLNLPASPTWYAGREDLLAKLPEDPAGVLVAMGAQQTTALYSGGNSWDARGETGSTADAGRVASVSNTIDPKETAPDEHLSGSAPAPEEPVSEN
jgi:hypothetical protein